MLTEEIQYKTDYFVQKIVTQKFDNVLRKDKKTIHLETNFIL